MAKRLNLAILLTGGGRTLKNLIEWREAGYLNADIGLVISSRPDVGGLKVARDAGLRTEVVDSRRFQTISAREGESIYDWEAMSNAIDRLILPGGFDLVCMAGFLSRYFIPEEFYGRVINIHPSLIPMFCGQDMYGKRVHEAVIASGVRISGCTVHFADNGYDTGPIILQRACPVYSDDKPADVAKRVFAEECRAYPAAINLIAEGRVSLRSAQCVHVDGDEQIERFGR